MWTLKWEIQNELLGKQKNKTVIYYVNSYWLSKKFSEYSAITDLTLKRNLIAKKRLCGTIW